MMYVEGVDEGVHEWVNVVQKLRYKDYQLASRPSHVLGENDGVKTGNPERSQGLTEVATVKEFSEVMHQRQVFEWWRSAMGYTQGQSDRL